MRCCAAILAGLALAVLIGGRWGWVAGAVSTLPVGYGLCRMEPPERRRERLRAAEDLPYAADLLGAALRAGVPLDRAVQAVAGAMSGPVGRRLAKISSGLILGLPPAQAWKALSDVPGGVRLTASVMRSSSSGAALANAFRQIGDELRAERMLAVESRAHRAGVLIVLPLGLCFLPAFVFAGVVPVIVAVLGDVLR